AEAANGIEAARRVVRVAFDPAVIDLDPVRVEGKNTVAAVVFNEEACQRDIRRALYPDAVGSRVAAGLVDQRAARAGGGRIAGAARSGNVEAAVGVLNGEAGGCAAVGDELGEGHA